MFIIIIISASTIFVLLLVVRCSAVLSRTHADVNEDIDSAARRNDRPRARSAASRPSGKNKHNNFDDDNTNRKQIIIMIMIIIRPPLMTPRLSTCHTVSLVCVCIYIYIYIVYYHILYNII